MRGLVLQAIALLALTAVATLLTWKLHPGAPALYLNAEPLAEGEVTIAKALEWEATDGVIWLDARPAAKYEQRHIPGAILLNEFDFNQLLMESFHLIANQDRPIIVYCGSRGCKASGKIADELREKMIPDVYVLRGGWDAWLAEAGNTGR